MAFDYLTGSLNLANLIFSQILKIDPSTIYKYTSVQDQVIYLLLIPHVILFLFIYAFSIGIVGRVIGGHVGFSRMVGIVSYIFLVWSGWYGTLVPLLNTWFVIALFAGLVIFLITAVMHPARAVAIEQLGGKVGASIGKKMGEQINKDKKIEDLYRQKVNIKKKIKECEDELAISPGNSGSTAARSRYRDALDEVEEQIRKLEG
jgi:hypothetical protein